MIENCKKNAQNLPPTWVYAELGEIFPLEYGKALPGKKRINTGAYPVYGSSGQVGVHESSIVSGPCLIIGRKGSAGKVFYSMKDCWPIDTAYFSRGNNLLDLRYMYYVLQFSRLDLLDNSTAIPSLSREVYNKVKIPLPPLAEQKRIVDRIECIFSQIDEGEKYLSEIVSIGNKLDGLATQLRQSILKAAFSGKLVEQDSNDEPASELLMRIQTEKSSMEAPKPKHKRKQLQGTTL